MQEKNKRHMKRPYFTLLLISAIVYFFLAVIWRYFAPLIVAFLILVGVEPGLSKWSGRLGIGRKPMAYISLVLIIVSVALCVWFGLIPYLQGCDFSWCQELLKNLWVQKVVTYLQEHGMGPVAKWSKTAIQISSKILFNIGAYGLSIFLLAGVFTKVKNKMEQQSEGRLILGISQDIISYAKAYLKTQGKLFLIISILFMYLVVLLETVLFSLLFLFENILRCSILVGHSFKLSAEVPNLGQVWLLTAVCRWWPFCSQAGPLDT